MLYNNGTVHIYLCWGKTSQRCALELQYKEQEEYKWGHFLEEKLTSCSEYTRQMPPRWGEQRDKIQDLEEGNETEKTNSQRHL